MMAKVLLSAHSALSLLPAMIAEAQVTLALALSHNAVTSANMILTTELSASSECIDHVATDDGEPT